MKVGFYLQNKGIPGLDCSLPLVGNPGIGGTEYLFSAIPYAITSEESNKHEIIVLTDVECRLADNLTTAKVGRNLQQTINKLYIEYLVLRYSRDNYEFVKSHVHNTKIIFWAHNFIPRKELSVLAKDQQVVCIVCVGAEQLQLYRDHQAFYKSVVIFNGYPVNHFINTYSNHILPFQCRRNEVTYLGNLVDYKGFHILAEAWKKILASVPDAHLNVIGGGNLYNRDQKLGKWDIAEESYENIFMPYLLDENGDILPSVTFHGVLGAEKNDILMQTKVGVPNPSGISETFCIAALEMQLFGAVISTINYGGFKDTIYKTGILYDSTNALAESVIAQLNKSENDYSGFIGFSRQFDFSSVAKHWIILFDNLQQTGSVNNILKPMVTKGHRFAECNRLIKKAVPFGSLLPSSMFYKSIIHKISNIFK